jgi:bifunctional UDP-N-acetylglucosamine pyrophosphorylase/glucosamine-1-phosphate N-acetyltransferase
MKVAAMILAAGKGTRMKSEYPKVIHKVCGKAMINYIGEMLNSIGISKIITIVGYKEELVKENVNYETVFITQTEQLGTGHAVKIGLTALSGHEDSILVINGDLPLVSGETIKCLLQTHINNNYGATLVTAVLEDPTGFGRIIRTADGKMDRIVEEKDASDLEKRIKEVNLGIYSFKINLLVEYIKELKNENAQGEYYLTDMLDIIKSKGYWIGTEPAKDSEEILAPNDRYQISQVERILNSRILKKHLLDGVTIIDPSSTHIHDDVKIDLDTIIYPGTIIEGKTVIGKNSIIGPYTRIVDSSIGNNVIIQNSVLWECNISDFVTIGPFAYLRPGSIIGIGAKVGDFVEIKNSTIGERTKIPHLSYIGDSEIGADVNIGAGVITVNYDGRKKHKTVVEDNAFVGCNTNLIAPVTLKKGCYIAAGSTINKEVPENALAIARGKQVNKERWIKRKLESREETNQCQTCTED